MKGSPVRIWASASICEWDCGTECPATGKPQRACGPVLGRFQSEPDGARLWLETNCRGGHRLWALNARHLEYLAAFVRSKDRTREFPSLSGSRQLADKLPVWMVEAKHRDEVLRALDGLRATL